MFRKLLIAISLICAITLVSGCSHSKEESRPRKEPSKKEEAQKPPKDKNVKKLTEDEVCELICGYYINKSYLEYFESTKSAVDSQKLGEMLRVTKDEHSGQYSLMHGDLHQGNEDCALTKIKYIEETNEYNIYFEPYYDSDETLLIYNADTQTFSYRGYGCMKLTEDEFVKFDDYDSHTAYLAYLALKNSPDVIVRGQKVYALVDETEMLIKIQSDATLVFSEEAELTDKGLSGYALLEGSQGDAQTYYYFIDDNYFTLRDEDANIIFSAKLD